MSATEFRKAHMPELISQAGGTTKLAKRVKVAPPYISNLKSGRNKMGEKTARKIEKAMCLPVGYLDNPPPRMVVSVPPSPPAPLSTPAILLLVVTGVAIGAGIAEYLI